MIRIAAISDMHIKVGDAGSLAPRLEGVNERADLLLLPGDLTDGGLVEEAQVLVKELEGVRAPVLAVLGNHDYMADVGALMGFLRDNGIAVLDGDTEELQVRGASLGIVGTKGFGGGFGEHALGENGERLAAAWVGKAKREAAKIERGLQRLATDFRVVMLHYAPIKDTIQGEPVEEFAFYGSSHLCKPIDKYGAHLVVHGHAHNGTHRGTTPRGIPVYNVAGTLLAEPYALLEFGG